MGGRIKLGTTVFSLFLFFGNTYCQEGWTLKQCIDYATQHNINVKQRELDSEAQKLRVNSAQMNRLPDLSASMGQNFYFGRGPSRDGTYTDQSQASGSVGISTSLPVFSGFRIWHDVAARKLDLQAAIEDLNKAKEDIAIHVTYYYLQVLFSRELADLAGKQLKISKYQLEKTDFLVKSGKSPESELYDNKASLAREELAKVEAGNALRLALLDLTQALNLDSAPEFDIERPDISAIIIHETAALYTMEQSYGYSVGHRPVIKSAQFRLESAVRELKSAKSEYYPKLSLGASYGNSYFHTYKLEDGMSNTILKEQLKRNGSESVSLSLSIPVFSRFSTRNQIRSARIAIENQKLQLDATKQALYKEIQQAYFNAVAAHEKFLSARKSVQASELAFSYEEQKYNAGKSTNYQFYEIKNRLTKSISEEIQAKYNFIFHSKILDFYNGKLLE